MAETLHYFPNLNNPNQFIIIPESQLVNGWGYQDYINKHKATTSDTSAPLNQNPHIQSSD